MLAKFSKAGLHEAPEGFDALIPLFDANVNVHTSIRGLTSAISGGAQSARRLLIAARPSQGTSLQAACRRATTAASHS